MDRAVRELLTANSAFYRAFEEADPLAMDSVWSGGASDTVVHPGWEICRGPINVRNSWRRIFSTGERLQFHLGNVTCDVHGDIGRVTAIEHIYAQSARALVGRVACTNLYLRVEGAWKMILHHGSPVHVPLEAEEGDESEEVN